MCHTPSYFVVVFDVVVVAVVYFAVWIYLTCLIWINLAGDTELTLDILQSYNCSFEFIDTLIVSQGVMNWTY